MKKNSDGSVTHMRDGVDHMHVFVMPGSVPSPNGLAGLIVPNPQIIPTPAPYFSPYDSRHWPLNHYLPESTGTPVGLGGQTLGSPLVTWDYGGVAPGVSFMPAPTPAQIALMQYANLGPSLFLNNEVARYERGQ